MRQDPEPSFIEQARRQQIVQAATSVIAEVGYAKASFARIADRAGISAGLISYHFADKADLITSVAAHITDQLQALIADRTTGSPSYRHALVAMVTAQVEFFATHHEEVAAISSIRADARDPATGQRIAVSQRRQATDQLEEFFAAGQAAGDFADMDARIQAASTLGALEAVPVELAARPDLAPGEYGRRLAAIVLQATGVDPTTARELADGHG